MNWKMKRCVVIPSLFLVCFGKRRRRNDLWPRRKQARGVNYRQLGMMWCQPEKGKEKCEKCRWRKHQLSAFFRVLTVSACSSPSIKCDVMFLFLLCDSVVEIVQNHQIITRREDGSIVIIDATESMDNTVLNYFNDIKITFAPKAKKGGTWHQWCQRASDGGQANIGEFAHAQNPVIQKLNLTGGQCSHQHYCVLC